MLHQSTVLVVEDDMNMMLAFEEFLRKEHCTMIGVARASDAMHALGREPIRLVIMEVRRMEQQTGESLRVIKRLLPDVPLIVITGDPELLPAPERHATDAEYYFLKPLELDRLRDAVKTCLHSFAPSP